VAQETVVALKVSSAAFNELGERYPEIWKPVAKELSRRLLERNNLLRTPNDKPRLFIISSVEALAVAYAVKAALDPYAECIVWDKGVFFAGDFSLEALERAINNSDFAVAIAQADDVVESRDVSRPTLRDNVLFEFGLFMGRITRHRAIMIHPKIPNLKIPTDLNGLTLLPYEHTHAESELPARLTSCCAALRDIIQSRGVRTLTS
jgi:predicted nucleotide-binding protein